MQNGSVEAASVENPSSKAVDFSEAGGQGTLGCSKLLLVPQ